MLKIIQLSVNKYRTLNNVKNDVISVQLVHCIFILCWVLKLALLKTGSTCGKINAILLNFKINLSKLVDKWTNFQTNRLTLSEDIVKNVKMLGGLLILTHPVDA